MKTLNDFHKAREMAVAFTRGMADSSSLKLVKYILVDTRHNTLPEIYSELTTALTMAGVTLNTVPDHAYIFAVARQNKTEIHVKHCLPLPEGIDPAEANYIIQTKFVRDVHTYQEARQKAIDYFINEVSESVTDDIKTFIVLKYPDMEPKAVSEYNTALKLAGITDEANQGTGYVFHLIANGTKFIWCEYMNPDRSDAPAWTLMSKIHSNVRGLGKLIRSRSLIQPQKTL